MFSRQKSPVKKKFAKAAAPKKYRRQLDPRTVVLLKQGFLGVALLVLVGVIGVAVWYGSRLSFVTIAEVSVSGGETIRHAEVQTAIETILEGEYIGLVPRRFIWTYPEDDIMAALMATPRLKNPMVSRIGTTLEVTFDEYMPHALWCTERESEDCYFIDDTGYAFTRAPKLSGGAFPRFHTIGTDPAAQSMMIATDDLRAIELIRERVSAELLLPIAYVETDIMRDVFLGVAGGGEIKATLRMSPDETVENLRTVLSAEEFTDIEPGSFQYIDLRFGNKVFVNEEDPSLATTTASSTVLFDEASDVSAAEDVVLVPEMPEEVPVLATTTSSTTE